MTMAQLPLQLSPLQQEFKQELIAIADWWVVNAIDREQGGFYGEISATNEPVVNATKGVILTARILWFFSEVAQVVPNADYQAAAKRAYDYLINFFCDKSFGGVYWELDAKGNPLNTKKQTYAQAFVIYGLCAYYQLTRDEMALAHALNLFELLETKTIDTKFQGYFEAFTREWAAMDDLRLSEKDLNFPKSQNTHLHILEAYTCLNLVRPDAAINAALRYNIELFDRYIIDKSTGHLRMFMDVEWRDHSPGYTYGHDIEASWLIAKALESLGDSDYSQTIMPNLLNIVQSTYAEAIGDYGQIKDSYDFASRQVNADTVWWVQAEALVGFLFAFQQTKQPRYLMAAMGVWDFIKQYQLDTRHGEWMWLSSLQKSDQHNYYKVGFWKCPYHNGRAMMEAIRYLNIATIP